MLRKLTLVILVLLLACPGVLAAGEKKLDLDMYFEMESVSGPQISPDGRQIVYSRGWVNKLNDSRESSIWIMNSDGSKNRFLLDGSSPKWSPDGSRIAYTASGEPRGSQIFVRWMDAEGAVSQITRVEKSPGGISWAPDGNSLAFSMLVPQPNHWKVDMPSRPEGAKWTADPTIIERFKWRQDRQGIQERGYTHLFTVPATGGTARQITSGNYNHGGGRGGGGSWTPDGKEILFSATRLEEAEYQYRKSDIFAVNVANGSIRQLTHRDGPDGSPVVSPDGRWVAYTGYDWTMQTYIESRLHIMGIDGSNPRIISDSLDRSPGGLRWANDGSGVYFGVSDRGTGNLYFASTSGAVRQVTSGNHRLSISDSSDAGVMVGTLTSPHEPGDIIILSANNPTPKQLTWVNDDVLADVQLGEVEEIWYDSVDDYRIQGWIIKPPDFDANKKYPMMLSIHGGPHGMYNVGFNFGWQEHAANGYVVLYTNPRGSSGYGTPFGNAINNDYPNKDFNDLMNGVDQALAKGYVDERNMFVYGCSGGGVLTAWVVGHTNRFAAASSNCPVINWMSFVGTTDGNLSWYLDFKELPWDDPTEHIRRSPLTYVGNVTTPTMLMTGELDLRTPMPQTEEFYQALKMLKVPAAMVRFKGEWHGTSRKPSNFARTQLYLRHWFERYTTKEMPPDVTPRGSNP